jgi:hypothetical protein
VSPRPQQERVYNLEVWRQHVYLVTNLGVLTHNACGTVSALDENLRISPTTKLSIETIEGDVAGKVHGILPRFVPRGTSVEALEDAAFQLEKSINARGNELARLGALRGHVDRIAEEEQLLSQIRQRLIPD